MLLFALRGARKFGVAGLLILSYFQPSYVSEIWETGEELVSVPSCL